MLPPDLPGPLEGLRGRLSPWLRVRRHLRRRVAARPPAYFALLPRSRRRLAVTADSVLVMEGVPRSGNSFAEAAFRLAQGDRDGTQVRMAHHLHAPAQIIRAAHLGVPAIVLVREPVDVCVSLLMKLPEVFTPEDILTEYVWFHQALAPYRDRFVVARFEQVSTDFGVVIDDLNQRFGCRFERFRHDAEGVRDAYALVDSLTAARVGSEMTSYSPGQPRARREQRRRLQQTLREFIETTSALRRVLADARAIHRAFAGGSGASGR